MGALKIYYVRWRTAGFVSQFGAEWEDGTYAFGENRYDAIAGVIKSRGWTEEEVAMMTIDARAYKGKDRV